MAFAPASYGHLPLHLQAGISSSQPLAPISATSTSLQMASKAPSLPRLTSEEETELLRQAVELRRLDKLEEELALRSPTKELPLLSIRARAAWSGDEWEAYEDA